MEDIHFAVYRYITNYDEKGEQIAKNIFQKVLKKEEFSSLAKNETVEDLFSEFYVKKVLPQRDKFQSLFKDNPVGIISYIRTAMYNFLSDVRDKRKLEEVKVDVEDKDTGENVSIVELASDNNPYKPLEYIEAYEISQKIKEFFSEEDIKVLCHIVFKDKSSKKYCLENLKENAIYKRVERFKKDKLKRFIKQYSFSQEGFSLFLKEFLMSEFCQKLCL